MVIEFLHDSSPDCLIKQIKATLQGIAIILLKEIALDGYLKYPNLSHI